MESVARITQEQGACVMANVGLIYPKSFQEETNANDDAYPLYVRYALPLLPLAVMCA